MHLDQMAAVAAMCVRRRQRLSRPASLVSFVPVTIPQPQAPDAPRPFVTVVIPTLNEAGTLPACVTSIGCEAEYVEIVVVDGGSDDGTPEVASSLGGRVLISPRRQRAAQLNLGAQHARGEVLLFLHADTLLPRGWRQALERGLRNDSKIVGGAFSRRFDGSSKWLAATCWLADWRGRWFGHFFGDQAMFVRADTFRGLGGFRSLDRCEDLDFSLCLRGAGRTCLLKPPVVSSARRFAARGPVRQTFADLMTVMKFLARRRAGKN